MRFSTPDPKSLPKVWSALDSYTWQKFLSSPFGFSNCINITKNRIDVYKNLTCERNIYHARWNWKSNVNHRFSKACYCQVCGETHTLSSGSHISSDSSLSMRTESIQAPIISPAPT